MSVKSLETLEAWKKAKEFALRIYQEVVPLLPPEEKWNLNQQLRRSSLSIPANIAEGYGRSHRGDYLRFLSIAKGSAAELETHLIIAVRLEFISKSEVRECWDLCQEVAKMLNGLVASLRRSTTKTPP